MDRRVIADKLERLRRCVQRIEHKRPPTLATLAADVDLQDILSVNLERAVQLGSMRCTYHRLQGSSSAHYHGRSF
jgi:hypothetical protein